MSGQDEHPKLKLLSDCFGGKMYLGFRCLYCDVFRECRRIGRDERAR